VPNFFFSFRCGVRYVKVLSPIFDNFSHRCNLWKLAHCKKSVKMKKVLSIRQNYSATSCKSGTHTALTGSMTHRSVSLLVTSSEWWHVWKLPLYLLVVDGLYLVFRFYSPLWLLLHLHIGMLTTRLSVCWRLFRQKIIRWSEKYKSTQYIFSLLFSSHEIARGAFTHRCCPSVRSFVCLSVAKMRTQKRDFLKN